MTKLQASGLVIAGIVVGLRFSAVSGGSLFGGVYNTVNSYAKGICIGSSCTATENKLTVGNSGTAIGNFIYGTCYLKGDTSIAATSTALVDCVSSSFKSGDRVIIGGLATSTTEVSKQISIVGTGNASTTDGYAPVRVMNWTGAALIPAAKNGLGSSTPFVIIRP